MVGQIPPPPGGSRRLTRSTRDRMWAGVASGMAHYFDLDPALVRLVWVAAAIVTSGLAVLVYIVLWIVLPREDRTDGGAWRGDWQGWSQELEAQTRHFADEARRMAHGMSEEARGTTVAAPEAEKLWTAVAETTPTGAEVAPPIGDEGPDGPSSRKTGYAPYDPTYAPPAWQTPPHVDREHVAGRQRTAGIILVVLGLLFFAQQAGFFRIPWNQFWPLILVAIGVALLLRRTSWR